jgi:hypothetical protein
MRLRTRRRLDEAAEESGQLDLLGVLVLCPVAETGGRPPGLHRVGRAGSTSGVWVYDPPDGEPQVPADRLAPWALVIGGEARPDW